MQNPISEEAEPLTRTSWPVSRLCVSGLVTYTVLFVKVYLGYQAQ